MINIARIASAVIAASGVEVLVRGEDDAASLVVPDGTPAAKKAAAEAAFAKAVQDEHAKAQEEAASMWLAEQEEAAGVIAAGFEFWKASVLDLLVAAVLGGKRTHAVLDASGQIQQLSARQATDALEALAQKRATLLARYDVIRKA